MAPGVISLAIPRHSHLGNKTFGAGPSATLSYMPGRSSVEQHDETYEHEHLRPRFPDVTWPALPRIPYEDKGLQGDVGFKHLLSAATDVFDCNPKIGTEIHGVDLARLTDAQKNDLARLIATRGVVFFRNQENFDIDAQRALGAYFGTLHRHATTSVPRKEGLEDVHVVFTGEGAPDVRATFTPIFLWHSDVSPSMRPGRASHLDRSRTKSSRRRTRR